MSKHLLSYISKYRMTSPHEKIKNRHSHENEKQGTSEVIGLTENEAEGISERCLTPD